jgi:hypothetical protein
MGIAEALRQSAIVLLAWKILPLWARFSAAPIPRNRGHQPYQSFRAGMLVAFTLTL